MNPVVTRKSDATRSLSNRPVRTSSPKPLATSSGEGNTDGGKAPTRHNVDQTAMTTRNTSMGSRRAFEGSGVSVIGWHGHLAHVMLALVAPPTHGREPVPHLTFPVFFPGWP